MRRWTSSTRVVGLLLVLSWLFFVLTWLTGQTAFVATRGISMQPGISAGDLVVTWRAEDYEVGDIAAYRSETIDTVVLHRIVARDGQRFVFQGDNNDFLDPDEPVASELIGKKLLHVPRGAVWLQRLSGPPAIAFYAFVLLSSGSAVAVAKRNRHRDRRTTGLPPLSLKLLTDLPPHLRTLAGTAAAVVVVGVALGGLAYNRPLTTVAAPAAEGDGPASSMTFRYTAMVPASPAYDGTTVLSPDPVFRSLTDDLEVGFEYTGEPGALAVVAELSTGNGWSATVPLAEERPVGDSYSGTVRLDVAQLERRATAAAAVIGVPAGPLSVEVVPKVSYPGGGSFVPALTLTADEYSIKPVGELTATGTASPEGSGAPQTVPAQLSALGQSVDVGTARVAAVLITFLGLVLGMGVVLLVLLRGPQSEAERTRQRHGSLLLPVLPVALPPGRPVIDVPDVDALARIAERYGLLVLHWSRSGVDTYVVQDEGTTFRYRTQAPVPVEEPAGTDGPGGAQQKAPAQRPVVLTGEDADIARMAADVLAPAKGDMDAETVVDVDSFTALRFIADRRKHTIHYADVEGLRFYFVLEADTAFRYYSQAAAERLDAEAGAAHRTDRTATVPSPRRPEPRTPPPMHRTSRA